jgi:hypothetical protein
MTALGLLRNAAALARSEGDHEAARLLDIQADIEERIEAERMADA